MLALHSHHVGYAVSIPAGQSKRHANYFFSKHLIIAGRAQLLWSALFRKCTAVLFRRKIVCVLCVLSTSWPSFCDISLQILSLSTSCESLWYKRRFWTVSCIYLFVENGLLDARNGTFFYWFNWISEV